MRLNRLAFVILIANFSSVRADPAPTAGGMSDITILSVDIGHFKYGSKIIHVFENSRNIASFQKDPEKWQFMIEPTLVVRDEDAAVQPLDKVAKKEGKFRVVYNQNRLKLPVMLIDDVSINKAIEVIYSRYPEAKCKVGPQNIDVLPITSLVTTINDIDGLSGRFHQTVHFESPNLAYLTSPMRLYLMFDIVERKKGSTTDELEAFRAFLPFLQMQTSVSFSVKSTAFNISSVTVEKLKETDLYSKLKGDGSSTFVTRDDLRTLTQSAATQMNALAIVEDRDSFDQALFRSLIDSANSKTVSADEAFFNGEQGKHTYDADDLKPSVLTKELNKVFDYDSSKDQWTVNTSASGGGSFLGIIKGDAKGSFSGSSLKEFLKKHSVESDIEGNKIVAKSIDLQQVNISKFLESGTFGTEYRNIEKGGPKNNLRTQIYGERVNETAKSFEEITKAANCGPATTVRLNVR